MLFVTFMPEPEIDDIEYYSKTVNSLYFSLSRSVFVIGLVVFLVPVIFGGGKTFLLLFGNKLTNTLGKLTFNVYLVHFIVIIHRMGISR
jgi:peptidoglycan/LPS O-acetylase OafA/YrhL